MNKKTFNVHYSFYLSDSIDIEAIDEKDAENKVIEMIENGQIGNLNDMTIGEQKVWTE